MSELFNEKNVDDVIDKKPLIVSWSRNGACGPSGLMLVIFDDGSSYAYSTFYKYRDDDLIDEIVESVPEFKTLMNLGKAENSKREPQKEQMRLTYLGLGNIAYVENKLFEKFLNLNGSGKYEIFKKVVKQYSGEELWDIARKVREYFNGVVF